ncbi:MAG: hypothetical protein ACR2NP_00785 [Pirellulaceae bacterium]
MRIVLLAIVLAGTGLNDHAVMAQSSEIETPDVKIMLGVAMASDEKDKLAFHFAAGAPVTSRVEMVTQHYTVMVPVTESVERDGKMVPVTVTRAEERTREVPVTRTEVRNDFSHAWDELEFIDIDGELVSVDEAKEHFQAKQPIVAIYEGSELSEFYSHVLRDDILVVVIPHPEGAGVVPGLEFRPAPRRR